ncbi:unnamed protein product, partial [marine sediment metagenome]
APALRSGLPDGRGTAGDETGTGIVNDGVRAVETTKILVIDDDPRTIAQRTRYLENAGYDVVCANSGREGMKALEEIPDISAVLCDRAMPDMSGDAVLKQVEKRFPEVKFAMITGFGGIMKHSGDPLTQRTTVLSKPLSEEELLRAVKTLLGDTTTQEEDPTEETPAPGALDIEVPQVAQLKLDIKRALAHIEALLKDLDDLREKLDSFEIWTKEEEDATQLGEWLGHASRGGLVALKRLLTDDPMLRDYLRNPLSISANERKDALEP